MKRLLLVLGLVLLGSAGLMAQRTVRGMVTGSDGEPLVGATVQVKGTTSGTATDLDGNYLLQVPEGANTLVFSYTGFASEEVELGPSDIVDVTLTQGVDLEAAVVTAVGIERNRRSLGYAVSELSSEQVTQRAESDVIRTLTGKVPGVNIQGSNGAPGASTNIVIRGYSSILGDNQPLFVVDGIPFDNSSPRTQNTLVAGAPYSSRALDIDPNDIESISVLKGAAASALYGSRAANGVISITTKSGRGLSADRRGQLFRLGGWITLTIGVLTLTRSGDMVDVSGHGALICLLLALIARPISRLWPGLLQYRRALGVGAFVLAVAHVAHMLSMGWDLAALPFLLPSLQVGGWAGIVAFVLMIPLALTSFDQAQKRLGRHWRQLHLLSVPIFVLAVAHTLLLGSSYLGDFEATLGNWLAVAVVGGAAALALLLRWGGFWSLLSLGKLYAPSKH
mgnify:CR=1 FL=1